MCGGSVVHGRHPAVTVYLVVVGPHIARTVQHTGVGVIGGHVPADCRRVDRRAET